MFAWQEAGNVPYVVENGCGKFSKSPKEIAKIVAGWFGLKSEELKAMSQNCLKLARPDAVFKIVHDLHELVREKNLVPQYSCETWVYALMLRSIIIIIYASTNFYFAFFKHFVVATHVFRGQSASWWFSGTWDFDGFIFHASRTNKNSDLGWQSWSSVSSSLSFFWFFFLGLWPPLSVSTTTKKNFYPSACSTVLVYSYLYG